MAEQTVVGRQQRGFVQGCRILEVGEGLLESSLLAPRTSSALLLDFEALFPSPRHRWIHAVLRHVALPPALLALVMAMYLGMLMTLVLVGEAVGEIPMQTGMRRGCPFGAILFRLFVRRLHLRRFGLSACRRRRGDALELGRAAPGFDQASVGPGSRLGHATE